MRIRPAGAVGVLLALFASAFLALECYGRDRRPRLRDADVLALERQGDSLRVALERDRQRRGTYPSGLAEAGLGAAAWTTPYGPWRYARAGEGSTEAPECRGPYTLALGHYDRHHFELCWDWRRGRWAWNR
jgi:hypothetical protein